MQSVRPCGYQVKEKLKNASDNNEHAIWALLLSLLALITTFQQQPNETVGLHCSDYPQNGQPPFLFGLFLELGSSMQKQSLHGARKIVLLGSSYLSPRKILALGTSTTFCV